MIPSITPADKTQVDNFVFCLKQNFSNDIERVTFLIHSNQYFVVSIIKKPSFNKIVYWVGKHKIDCVGEFDLLGNTDISEVISNYYETKIRAYEIYLTYNADSKEQEK